MEGVALERSPVEHKDLSVEDARIACADFSPVAIDAIGLRLRPRPGARLEREGDSTDVMEGQRFGHSRKAPSEITTAVPPMVARVRAPFSTLSPSVICEGRPIS